MCQPEKVEPGRLLEQLSAVFSEGKEVAIYFKKELSWLEQRRHFWDNHTWRVGLIGITSSGKSTLINSLIQEKLLPAKVRPTSNVLVHCAWGEKTSVQVIYDTGRAQELTRNIRQELSLLADEETNPFNRKGVKEIRVFSPKFRLKKDIVLVDTPGLDAVGQDRIGGHDDITLKLLLPTVDMVMYLVTCKVSSDRENNANLTKIDNQGKPILVVQNMIDSIRPKIGTGGKVEKDVDGLLLENRQRLKGLMQHSQNPFFKNAPIVQVSAQWALDPQNYQKSNVDILKSALEKMIQDLKPSLYTNRCKQIEKEVATWLDGVKESSDNQARIEKLEEYLSGIKKLTKDLKDDCQKDHHKLDRFLGDLEELETRGKELKERQLCPNDQQYLGNRLSSCKAFCETFQKALSGKITQANSEISRLSSLANISKEDLMFSLTQTAVTFNTKVETRETKITKRVKRQTIMGGVARIFGSILGHDCWGYDYVDERQTNLHYSSFHKVVTDIVRWVNTSYSNLKIFEEYISKCLNRINIKFLEDIEGQQDKQKVTLQPAKLQMIAAKLEDVLVKISSASRINEKSVTTDEPAHPSPSKWREIEISQTTHHLVALAHAISLRQLSSIRFWVLEQNKATSSDVIFIWGKDQILLNSFIRQFWHDEMIRELEGNESLIEDNAKGNGKLLIVNESHLKTEACLPRFKGKRILCFYMFNLAQVGAASKHFAQSIIHKIQGEIAFIPVVDSCEEFITSQNLDELWECFAKVKKTYFDQSVTAIINHANPLFSILLHEVVYNHRTFLSQKDEMSFLEEIDPWMGDISKTLVSTALRNLGKRQRTC